MTEKKSLNQKVTELEAATDWFYSEDFRLDEATKHYKEALTLAKEINQELDTLKNEVQVLTEDFSRA